MERKNAKTALLVIDMQNGFVDKNSPFCIAGAAETVPACERAVRAARRKGMPVFFVTRSYCEDGSDVEITRYRAWKEADCPFQPGSFSAALVAPLSPEPGDYGIVKPRWSAFFQTKLDLILRRLGVETVILLGTTTPNCIRTTAYDANALDYQVGILSDATSSQTEEIQRVNLEDLQRMGAILLTVDQFVAADGEPLPRYKKEERD